MVDQQKLLLKMDGFRKSFIVKYLFNSPQLQANEEC